MLGGAPSGGGSGSRRGFFPQGCAPHSLFETSKRECAAPGGREKMFRRVGPHTCGPPAAGGGRLALPRGNQGRKRAALGVIQARGSPGYLPLRFYPQGVRRISPQGGRDIRSAAKPRTAVQRKAAEPQTAAQSLPLAFPRGTMERQRGQAQGPCDFPPR